VGINKAINLPQQAHKLTQPSSQISGRIPTAAEESITTIKVTLWQSRTRPTSPLLSSLPPSFHPPHLALGPVALLFLLQSMEPPELRQFRQKKVKKQTLRIMMSPSMLASLLGPVQDPTLGITPSTHRTIHALHLFAFILPFWKLTVLVIVSSVSQIRLVIHLQSYHRPLGHSLAMSTTPRHEPSKFPTCSPANILLSPYNVPFKSSLNESYDFQRLAKAFITSPPSPFPAITNNPNQ
jgi:hypothetical protein